MARILLDTCVWGGAIQPLREMHHAVDWAGQWEPDPGDLAILEHAHREPKTG